jgi:NTP pyrophosphatase (non-canonical NTP hydrolase)
MSMSYVEFLSYINSRYTEAAVDQQNENMLAHGELLHAVLGLNGEVGELTDLIKKSVVYGRPWDNEKILSELGDVIHYYMRVAHLLNHSLPTIMEANKQKLDARDAKNPNHYVQISDDELLAKINKMI